MTSHNVVLHHYLAEGWVCVCRGGGGEGGRGGGGRGGGVEGGGGEVDASRLSWVVTDVAPTRRYQEITTPPLTDNPFTRTGTWLPLFT